MHPPSVKALTKPQGKSGKHKGVSSSNCDSVSHSKKKSFKPHLNPPELNYGEDMEVDVSGDNEHTTSHKKQKTATGYVAIPLHRTG